MLLFVVYAFYGKQIQQNLIAFLIMKTRTYFTGFNGFRQFGNSPANVTEPTEFSIEKSKESLLYAFSWSYNIVATGNKLVITGFVKGESNNCAQETSSSPVKDIVCNDDSAFALLQNGFLYKIDKKTGNFATIELPKSKKRSNEGDDRSSDDKIKFIAAGSRISIAISENGVVFDMETSSKVYKFQDKIRSLACGIEHALVLTENGEVYSWGNGLRGQLGHPTLAAREEPNLVVALQDVKVTKIAAGGWHSAVVTADRRLYLWGSNVQGQLGLPVHTLNSDGEKFKNPTVFQLPQEIDVAPACDHENVENCGVKGVVCGSLHTVFQTMCNKIFCVGWNAHGQLGIGSREEFVDNFTQIDFEIGKDVHIKCGPWCTIFFCLNE